MDRQRELFEFSFAQYSLIVGVVVAVATELGKGVLTSGSQMLRSLTSSSGCFEKIHF